MLWVSSFAVESKVFSLEGEMRCTGLVLQWIHAHASVYGGGHFTRPSYLTVTCSVLFRLRSTGILNTSGDDFGSCFRILGSTADTRAHASVYGVWGRLHVFPREEREIFIGETSGGHVIVLLRREGVLGKVVVSYVALLVFGLKKPSSVRSRHQCS